LCQATPFYTQPARLKCIWTFYILALSPISTITKYQTFIFHNAK